MFTYMIIILILEPIAQYHVRKGDFLMWTLDSPIGRLFDKLEL